MFIQLMICWLNLKICLINLTNYNNYIKSHRFQSKYYLSKYKSDFRKFLIITVYIVPKKLYYLS